MILTCKAISGDVSNLFLHQDELMIQRERVSNQQIGNLWSVVTAFAFERPYS
jgi:hypothetical protein